MSGVPTKAKHPCSRCCKSFTRAANLRRHLQDRKTICTIGERVGRISVRDATTHRWRPEVKEERAARIKRQKREYYQRHRGVLQASARLASHRRRGARQGTMPEKEQRKKSLIKWRRIIRAVHWRDLSEIGIFVRALDLARNHSPGDKDVPQAAKDMYREMKKIFANHPEYWDATRNDWNEANFDYESSGGDPFSDLERIYAASEFEGSDSSAEDW